VDNSRFYALSEYADDHPELVFGLVGPIGVDLETVEATLCGHLRRIGYEYEKIRVTEIMQQYAGIHVEIDKAGFVQRYQSLIKYANTFCEEANNRAALAGLCVIEIQKLRAAREESGGPAPRTAYIIRQLKRKEEIDLLKKTYGRKFVQISIYASEEKRTDAIVSKIRLSDHKQRTEEEVDRDAKALIAQDADESDQAFGQRVGDIFYTGDVFVYGIGKPLIEKTISRFIDAFFGSNSVSPTKDEQGLYMATAASLRSADLSRQVGAAICGEDGQIISVGCNEVPKAGGGAYWQEEGLETHRDIDRGADANYHRKIEIICDFIAQLDKLGLIKNPGGARADDRDFIKKLLASKEVRSSQIMDIIEFGRMMHAEMAAIVECARNGLPIRGATLYCTTFPCHMCAKHIVGSGIARVVFLEPYPKSYAKTLHSDSIGIEELDHKKVRFEPFIGIAPTRYRDIFRKGKRKDDDGVSKDWHEGKPIPQIEDRSSVHLLNEEYAIAFSLKEMLEKWKASE
jgi:deoxycytidylate deaminase